MSSGPSPIRVMACPNCHAPIAVHPQLLLTHYEVILLAALAGGMTDKEIARRDHYAVKTIKNYLSRLYGKLRVRSRTEAAVWAVHHGLYGQAGTPNYLKRVVDVPLLTEPPLP